MFCLIFARTYRINTVSRNVWDELQIKVHLINNKRHVIRTTLTEMEEQLPSDNFIRIHKSYVVNKKHITEVRANNVIIDQKELAIGRTFQQNLVNVF